MSMLGKRKRITNSYPPAKNQKLTTYRRRKRTPSYSKVASMMGIELKNFDQYLDTSLPQTSLTGAVISPSTSDSLCGIQQGDGAEEREGRKVTMKKLFLNVQLYSTSVIGVDVRLMIVQDTQTNGNQLVANQVLVNTAPDQQLSAFRNLANTKRIKVLYDQIHHLAPSLTEVGSVVIGSTPRKYVKIALDLKDTIVTYTGTQGTIANIQDNSWQLIAFASDSQTDISYASRCRFYG